MYITSLEISNIRSVTNFKYEMRLGDCAGWHVILGDNGSGKSSVIRSLAILFAGGPKVSATRQIWEDWLSINETTATIEAQINRDPSFDQFILKGKQPTSYTLRATIGKASESDLQGTTITYNSQNTKTAERTIWAAGNGWFSSSFGPYRRFSGGDRDWDRLYVSPEYTRMAAHLSAFGEDVAFSEALIWLKQLKVNTFEDTSGKNQRILDSVVAFINASNLLPHGSAISEISTKSVKLTDAAGVPIAVEQMSDGYRSVLSLTFELLRQMFLAFGDEIVLSDLEKTPGTINLPGVVAIDEIDAHLHPTWQAKIGHWFVEHFPNVQFFATTHSPLVCRAAAKGSIWRLPEPGSTGTAERVTGQDFDRLVSGDILDAYGTDFFGEGIDTPKVAKEAAERIARLSMKRSKGELSAEESVELKLLQASRPTVASSIG
ncbi:AAA family ATPase [Pseudogemmobacter sp. W21_MBD1_M6]|uniref:AAA family ATPase n=1 Tax=Pseudogemmobacter sp. W21_MBD1_M6 TaxID=3240271 RepID=UPI003F980CBE